MLPIILASTSPRRKEIMDKLCIPYEAVAPDYEEDMTLDLVPNELAKHLALGKAQSIASRYPNHLIIGSDTFCALDNKLLGKPTDRGHAKQMLGHMSEKIVSIITGLAFVDTSAQKVSCMVDKSDIYFDTLNEDQISRYLNTGEREGKAGAFALQGTAGVFIKRLEGDYNSMIGLPLRMVYQFLHERGYLRSQKL